MFRSLIPRLRTYTISINKLKVISTSASNLNTIKQDDKSTQQQQPQLPPRKDKKYGDSTPLQKILKMKDLIDFLVYGAFGVALYYAYQRYKRWNEIKEELKAQQIDIKGFKQKFYQINGYFFPEIMVSVLNDIKEFQTRPSDVWVASFPKSGTTWLQEMIYLIENDCDFTKAKAKTLEERSPFIEYPSPGIKHINKMNSPRVIKTHLPFEFLPQDVDKKSKIVYAVRNPKDVCVSFYYFIRMVNDIGFSGTISEMIELFIDGKIPYGPWAKHVDSYASNSNVLLIHYEDMIHDPKRELKRLCDFLGKKLDEKQMDAIIEWCSFDNMKKNPSVNYEWNKTLGIFAKEGEFFRKGQVGDWLNHFKSKQSKRLDDVVHSQLKYKQKFDYGISEEDLNKIYSTANDLK